MSRSPQTSERRKPQQARAAARRARFLDAAARLIGEHGYEAVTMTAVAGLADASIGTLYDYFPDKPALAQALLAHCIDEADGHWKAVLHGPTALTGPALADLFVDALLAFVAERPAYLMLLAAPIATARTQEARQPLRRTIVGALQAINRRLPQERALTCANVIVELLKAVLAATRLGTAAEKAAVAGEFRVLITLYLETMAG